MTDPLSSAAEKNESQGVLLRAAQILALITCLLLSLWIYKKSQPDPYIERTLAIKGSIDKGDRLFRMNCVGCHGITAQGLVGPDLHQVSSRINDKQIINQVIKGLTPPMPSFEMESESMADLLAYLHTLD